jgi:predicted ATPase
MIEKFGVENFKAFADKTELELKPLTILTGTNSSGKSSFTQALRLLQSCNFNSFAANDQIRLKFSDKNSLLGNINSIRPAVDMDLSFTFPTKFPGLSNKMEFRFSFYQDESSQLGDAVLKELFLIDTTYEEETEIFRFIDNGFTYRNIDGGDYPYREVTKKLNFSFLLQEFEKLADRLLDTEKSYSVLEAYLKKEGQTGILFNKQSIIKEFFKNKKLPEEIESAVEIWLKNKEFYISGDDYKEVILDGNKQSYLSPNILNDLAILNDDEGGNWAVYRFDKNYYNHTRILEYNKTQLLFSYKLKNGVLSKKEINEIKKIEIHILTNYTNFNNTTIYDLSENIFLEDSFTGMISAHLIKNLIQSAICEKLNFSKEVLSVENGDNYLICFEGFIKKGIQYCFQQFKKEFLDAKIEYIPSIRAIPNRFVSRIDVNTYLGRLLENINLNNTTNTILLNKWLMEFEIADEFSIEYFGSSGVSQINLIKGNKKINITDVGYGVSQILPILIRLCLFDDKVVIIEEPETNLHPALQSKLADFLVAIGRNKQIIVETHSEYLIRRLQVLISKNEIANDRAIVHYFYPPTKIPKGEKQVKTIRFEKNGIMDGAFGSGFTDEANNSAIQLFQLTKGQYN